MKAFIIMPFRNKVADSVYRLSTKPICEEFKLEVRRADEIFTTNPILDDILSAIKESSIIITDISGKNPNVFYELGIAHLLKQTQTIMVTQDELGQIPFDISHFRILKYENSIEGKATYETQLRLTLKNILKDFKSIFKDEFEAILNVYNKTSQDHELYFIMALDKISEPLKVNDNFNVNGHNDSIDTDLVGVDYEYARQGAARFMCFDLVRIFDDVIIITEKGRAFSQFLTEHGYVLDKVEKFSETGFKTLFDNNS